MDGKKKLNIKVLYFGKLKHGLEISEENICLFEENASLQSLIHELITKHPQYAEAIAKVQFACNLEYVQHDTKLVLHNGDEIALIPQISGG